MKLEDEGIFEEETIAIAEAINVPVIMVGGLRSLEYINKIYENTKIEYFSLARPLISERDLINKWIGNTKQRAKCVSCGNCFGQRNGIEYTCILDRK